MAKVLQIKECQCSERHYNLLDMVSNHFKKQQVYDHYDNKYVETEEEQEILKQMTKRRKR